MNDSARFDGSLAVIEISGVGCGVGLAIVGSGVSRGAGCWGCSVVSWTVVSGRKMASRKLDTVD